MNTDGELKKLTIMAFSSIKYDEQVDELAVLFNPSSYQQKYEIEYGEAQGLGTTGQEQPFGRVKLQDYTFELIFDATGAAGPPRPAGQNTVDPDITAFLDITGRMDGSIHRPYYLRLSWGSLVLRCVLKSADITYTLFRPDGYPLRAKVNAVFSEVIENELRAKKEGKESPDVTHARTVQAGDTLPLLVHRIYGKPTYAAAVARWNGLRHLRDIHPGQVLYFPPLINQGRRGAS
jgi:hypothetical protein